MVNSSIISNDEGSGSLALPYEAHIQNSTIVNNSKGVNIGYSDKLYLRNSIILSRPDSNGETGENCEVLLPAKVANNDDFPVIITEGGNVFFLTTLACQTQI